MSAEVRVEAWRVHDTGLVAAPGPFRRLPGAVRHHRGAGLAWPARVVLTVGDDGLQVATPAGDVLGCWPHSAVTLRMVGKGPPISFVVEVPGAAHLLSAASRRRHGGARRRVDLAALTSVRATNHRRATHRLVGWSADPRVRRARDRIDDGG